MSRNLQASKRTLCSHIQTASYRTFQPGDIAVARHVLRPDRPSLSTPLSPEKEWNAQASSISHSDVIGKSYRSSIKSQKGHKNQTFILTHPTLEEYATHRKRLAQPIYPLDAAAIVTLADIHEDETGGMGFGRVTGTARDLLYPEFPETRQLHNESEDSQVEDATPIENAEPEVYPHPKPFLKMRQYLEAGTGHGSLTLAICRAIHGANYEYRRSGQKFDRGAVLHSIDRNANHSKNGRVNVRDFRRGMYIGDVEFHLAESPEKWLQEKGDVWRKVALGEDVDPKDLKDSRYGDAVENESPEQVAQDEPKEVVSDAVSETISEKPEDNSNSQEFEFETPGSFLSGAFLDLPSPEFSLNTIADRLITDAPLVIFCPSISQIQDLVEAVRVDETIDMTLTNTVELLPGISGGSMRAWDVRSTVVRDTGEVVKVCRPRVGTGVTGGGFVAVFRKLPYRARIMLRQEKEKAAQKEPETRETSPSES